MKRLSRQPRLNGERATVRTFLEPAAFLTPFLIGLILFTLYPFINVFLISFKEGYKVLSGEFTSFGFQNYETVMSDPNFLNGLKNTGLYVVLVVPIATVLSLLIATLLNNDIKLKGFFQTCYFLPMVTSITAIGLVWKWLFNFDYGLINYFLSVFGIDPVNWLNNPAYNLAALVIYGVWSMIPFTTILLLAGFQNVNPPVLHRGPRRRRKGRQDLLPHHAAAARADDRADADREHDLRIQGVFRAVPAVQRAARLGVFALYGCVLSLRRVFCEVEAGPRGGERRDPVCHRAGAHDDSAVHSAEMEELLSYEDYETSDSLSDSGHRRGGHGAAVRMDAALVL